MRENMEFFIPKDGIKLHCKLDFPAKQKEKMPLVILQHGLTGHMEERHLLAVKSALTGIGYAVLRSELYGHGRSQGDFKDHSVWEWVLDFLKVIDYARKLDFVDDIYLSGHSQGGLLALLTGAMEADRIKGLILLAPATVIKDCCREGHLWDASFDPDHIPDHIVIKDKIYGGNYFRTGKFLPVDECIRGYQGPVLIVHGDADESVPIEYARDAAKKYADARLVEIPGDTHCYDHHLDQVLEAVVEFMKDR